MRRKALAIFLILIFASIVAAWFFLPQTNDNPLQTKDTLQAKITEFTMDRLQNGPLVGVTYGILFNVTVQNVGSTNVTGATVLVERIANDNETTAICSYDIQNVTVLHPGETQIVTACILVNLDNLGKVGGSNFLAALSVNGTVLDERKLF